MQTHVIVSYDGTDNDHDALALGKILGDAGARVSLAYVRHTEEADTAAEQVAQNGLRALAEREHADLVVFGSDWHTAPGHVQPGRSAVRLMEGGPVSIAIAAAGLRERSDATLRTIALAGGEVDDAARTTAEQEVERVGEQGLLPSQDGVDLLVVGSRPGTPAGQVSVTAANEYVVETTTSSVLILARGVVFDVAQSGVARAQEVAHARQ